MYVWCLNAWNQKKMTKMEICMLSEGFMELWTFKLKCRKMVKGWVNDDLIMEWSCVQVYFNV